MLDIVLTKKEHNNFFFIFRTLVQNASKSLNFIFLDVACIFIQRGPYSVYWLFLRSKVNLYYILLQSENDLGLKLTYLTFIQHFDFTKFVINNFHI